MYEKAKIYLWSYRKAKKDYIRAKLELQECETMLTNISVDYSKEKVKSSPNSDKLAEAIDRLDKLKDECINASVKATEKLVEVKATIDKVDEPVLRDLLSRYYLQGATWEKISVDTDCSWTGVHKRHARALEKVEKLI